MEFENHLSPDEREQLIKLTTPQDIQIYLDGLPYVGEDLNRSPLRVMRDGQGHCLDGGIFAALVLRKIGYRALIVDLVPEPGTDDDHVLAIFMKNNYYGAVAKSNFVGLRYREPVYRSLRELAMSYFEGFYNIHGVKTLRGYTRPLDLSRFDCFEWGISEDGVEKITTALYRRKPIYLLTPEQVASLTTVDRRSYEAGLLGSNYDGLYKPAVGLGGEWAE